MAQEGFKRKLAAIFSADVEGYSRLMGEDEEATVRTLTAYRDVFTILIQQNNGKVLDSPGDNLLAEFASVVDAVKCSVAVQKEIKARNEELPENRRMQFRIGINLGDVIQEEDGIYGDGVNIAARLESLADPGGICISRTAYDQVKKKLELGYEYLGDHAVKNITEPVRVYRVLTEPEAAGKVIGERKLLGRVSRRMAISVISILVIIAVVLIGWNIYLRQSYSVEPASPNKMAFPLPKKPSIAVLPFDNLSEDPEQSYFSDGLTEEIINALSKVPYLFVIAKDSAFNYKNKPAKIKQVSEELGVRYILKGNVRKDSERIRLTVQLIDAMKGHYLWSERYERDLKDIFALQDEITMKIITGLQVKLTMGEQARIQGKGTTNLDAYLKFLESREHFSRFNKEANIRARELAKEAIALDPEYASAHGQVGFTHWAELIMGWSESRKTSFKQMANWAQKALALKDSEPRLHSLQAQVYQIKKQFEKSLIESEKAISLSPNHAGSYVLLGHTLRFMGRPEEAVEVLKHAIRLNPFPNPMYYVNLASSYLFLGKYEEAIEVYKKALRIEPNNLPANIGLAVAYSSLGKEDEARTAGAEILRINPRFSVDRFAKRLPYRIQSYNDLLVEGLRKAGLQ